MSRTAVIAAVVLVLDPAFASEPGQPLDCSDWVFLEPGFSCSTYVAFPCDGFPPPAGLGEQCELDYRRVEVDNEGFFYRIEMLFDVGETCDTNKIEDRLQLVQYDGTRRTVVGYVQDRCNADSMDVIRPEGAATSATEHTPRPPAIRLDSTNGRMYISLIPDCLAFFGNPCYEDGREVVAIAGFATTFEVLQSFTPNSSLSFRVPYMPEGMGGADHFDTYWGNLANPIDFTQAQPLQCNYPDSPPQVGDYLSVADTLPNPPAGTGRYYVTAATYQGQTRYGRKASGGRLSGRDPALLPGCSP